MNYLELRSWHSCDSSNLIERSFPARSYMLAKNLLSEFGCGKFNTKHRENVWHRCAESINPTYTGTAKLWIRARFSMEFSTRSPFLDQFGKPLPEHIQHVLDELTPRLRRK